MKKVAWLFTPLYPSWVTLESWLMTMQASKIPPRLYSRKQCYCSRNMCVYLFILSWSTGDLSICPSQRSVVLNNPEFESSESETTSTIICKRIPLPSDVTYSMIQGSVVQELYPTFGSDSTVQDQHTSSIFKHESCTVCISKIPHICFCHAYHKSWQGRPLGIMADCMEIESNPSFATNNSNNNDNINDNEQPLN